MKTTPQPALMSLLEREPPCAPWDPYQFFMLAESQGWFWFVSTAWFGCSLLCNRFSQLLITALALVMATREHLSGVGHAPRLVISAPFLSVVSVGWTGRKGWECYWVSVNLLSLSLSCHEQTLACCKLRSKACVWLLVILDAQGKSTGSPSEQMTRSCAVMPDYGLWESGRPGVQILPLPLPSSVFSRSNLFGL